MILDMPRVLALGETLGPGTTARTNHDNCPSGEDTRRRLYVTRSDDNTGLKCYCHNCGQGTVINLRNAPKLRKLPSAAPKKFDPKDMPPSIGLHPRHSLWLKAFGIEAHAMERGVYSVDRDTLVFPAIHCNGISEATGYQIRRFDSGLKWESHGRPLQWWAAGEMTVYVEDVVSAYKWVEATGQGYVMMAGNRDTVPKSQSWMGYRDNEPSLSRFPVVWFDNDKPSVVEAAEGLIKHLTHATKTVGVLILGGTDPKRYSKDELVRVADACIQLVKSTPPDGGSYHVLTLPQPGEGVCT